ncbi:MAG: hypothetical protein EPO68_00210 [Planctomycetota bacterium]|nr:MAG: hypothetical protein EPO68_00210 [Planctomycetota bacterium]
MPRSESPLAGRAAHRERTCATVAPSTSFQVFRALNDPALAAHAHHKGRIDARALAAAGGARLEDKLVRALIAREALPAKEVWESFEVFARARRALRGKCVVDVCCGHGLAGLLFAVFERSLDEVVLVDEREPANHAAVLAAVADVAPWVPAKVRWVRASLKSALPALPRGAALLAVHACGVRTDRALEAAIAARVPLVAVPCCYEGTAHRLSRGLVQALGVVLAVDVDRTYRLERAGFRVRWTSLPAAITPMNRVIVAQPDAR